MITFNEPEIIKLKMGDDFLKRNLFDKNFTYIIYFTPDWDGDYPSNMKPYEIEEILNKGLNSYDGQIEIYTVSGFTVAFNDEHISDLGFILPVMFID